MPQHQAEERRDQSRRHLFASLQTQHGVIFESVFVSLTSLTVLMHSFPSVSLCDVCVTTLSLQTFPDPYITQQENRGLYCLLRQASVNVAEWVEV